MKRFLTVLLATAILTLGIAACGKKEDTSAAVGSWQTAQTIQPFFYGEYLEDGYEVEVLPFTNPGDQKTALLAGELDMTGTTMVTAITAAEKGEPIRIVAGLCNKCSALVVKKDSGIKKPEDLKGKHIAYVPGTMHHALLLEVLKRAGLDADKDVELLQIDFFDMGQALREGSIDAFLSGEPYPSEALLDGYGEILEYPYFDDSIGTINAAMIVREETIREEPGKVQALVNAHVKATRALQEDEQKWLDAAYKFGTSKEVMDIAKENMELGWDIDQDFITHTKALAKKMKELGIIREVPDVDAMFDLSFLEKAEQDEK
ncbi:MAG: ABC transporter substrate-binding protein [Lachnospiraceae bacterium]|jgi:NitT/TauT family transport system substrate-binding protein|nr:ABC transporter substrate-binding protein [Lachnospiraceae bacterium]